MRGKVARLVVGLTISGLLVWIVAGLIQSATPDASQERTGANGLLTTNRSTLDVCIQPTDRDASVAGAATDLISVLNDVSAVEGYAEFYPPQPAVTLGCPTPTLIMGRPVDEYRPDEFAVRLAPSDSPSIHRVLLYVVPTDEYDATFGDQPYFRVSAEMICQGRVCRNVTTGLYVPEAAAEAVVAEALLRVLGLQAPEPDPTWDPEALDRRRREALEGNE